MILHGMNLCVQSIKGYDRSILEEVTRTTPIYPTCIGHSQNVTCVQEILGKNIFGVHIPYSADWVPTMLTKIDGTLPNFCIFTSLFPSPPRKMLSYCMVSDKSLVNFPKYTGAMFYLQEITLFWKRGLFVVPKS